MRVKGTPNRPGRGKLALPSRPYYRREFKQLVYQAIVD
jgi:hypothetical protein